MTAEQIIQKANDRMEWINKYYSSPPSTDISDQYPTRFDYYSKEIWKDKMTREKFDEIMSYENILKAETLKANVEKIGYDNYDKYHWILETPPLFHIFHNNWENEIKVEGYLGTIIKHNGDIDAAFADIMGDAEILIDYANDIASTAF